MPPRPASRVVPMVMLVVIALVVMGVMDQRELLQQEEPGMPARMTHPSLRVGAVKCLRQ